MSDGTENTVPSSFVDDGTGTHYEPLPQYDNYVAAIQAVADKLTASERIWADRIAVIWNDPQGRRITSREWERVRTLAAQAAQR